MAKSTNLEMDKRIKEVFNMIINSVTTHDIIKYCEDTYKIKEVQAYTLIKRARKVIENYAIENQEYYLRHFMMQLDDLYKKNKKEGNLQECRKIVQDKFKMLGFESINLNFNKDNDFKIEFVIPDESKD